MNGYFVLNAMKPNNSNRDFDKCGFLGSNQHAFYHLFPHNNDTDKR